MCDKSINQKVCGGYAILALKNLGYRETSIHDFLNEFNTTIKRVKESTALKAINNFLDESTRQVIFEGIQIPKEYNMVEIRHLFESYGFMGKEYNYMGKRVCNGLEKEQIIRVKDLYGKTKRDILYINPIGVTSYEFFIKALQKIFSKIQ